MYDIPAYHGPVIALIGDFPNDVHIIAAHPEGNLDWLAARVNDYLAVNPRGEWTEVRFYSEIPLSQRAREEFGKIKGNPYLHETREDSRA